MSLFEFCLEIIKREGKRFNVGINNVTASQITAATASDVNFDIAHNRCSFLYRCGTINLAFARDCFKKFLSDEKRIFFASKLDKCQNLTVCSIGKGPALDYIALLLSYQECNILPKFKNVRLISKYGAWRNTANIMLEILKEGFLPCFSSSVSFGDIEVIQGDPFVEFTDKVKHPICDSDVILMVKALNLQADGYDQIKIAKRLQEFLDSLKPDAVIFCVDTKPSIAVITHQLCSFPGTFLYEPTYLNTMINLEHADLYKGIFGCCPVVSARGSFFVWQKSSTPLQRLESFFASFKSKLDTNDNKDNVYSSKLSEDSDKLFDNSYNKQQIDSISTSLCDLNINKNFKLIKSNSSDQLLGNNNIDQNPKYFLASPLQKNSPTYDYVQKSSKLNKKLSNAIHKAVQTESEDLKEIESIEVIKLSEKIAQLTTTLSEMLQMNELDGHKNDSCIKDVETKCEHSILNDHIHNHHSSITSCIHSCPCKLNLQPIENCISCKCCQKRVFENFCQNHICHEQEQVIPNRSSCSTPLDDFEAPKCYTSCHSSLKLSKENNLVSIPKLVIPLNNLTGSAVSQIFSIIAQSNQEQ